MPNTPDHKATMFRLARERQAAGKPVWDHHIDVSSVFHNETMAFTERRDAIVRIVRASKWLKDADEFGHLVEVIENLADAEDTTEFDGWFDELYDLADYHRVWINTNF